MNDENQLNPLHERAIELRLAGASLKQIGESLGRDRSSVLRWFRNPRIAAEYRARIGERADAVSARLTRHLQEAIDVLVDVMKDPDAPAQTRLQAAHSLLVRGLDTAAMTLSAAPQHVELAPQQALPMLQQIYGIQPDAQSGPTNAQEHAVVVEAEKVEDP